MEITLYFDGSCEPINPGGVGTFGYVLSGLSDLTGNVSEIVAGGIAGEGDGMTNNVAEYRGLMAGLDRLGALAAGKKYTFGPADTLLIRGDSKLVVEQVAGNWRCHAPHLRELLDRVRAEITQLGFGTVRSEWVPRERNERADALAQAAFTEFTGLPFPERRRA